MSQDNFDAAPNLFFPSLVTPLTEDGDLDADSARRLVARMFEQGAGGVYCLSDVGEGMHLSEAARKEMADLAADEAKKAGNGQVCVVHVSAAEPAMALRLAKHARRIGAGAVASLPPFVCHYSHEYAVQFFADLADACSPVPVLACHAPDVVGADLTVDQLASFLRVDGVVGLNYADADLGKMDRVLARCPDALVLNGVSHAHTAALLYGARGGTSGSGCCLCSPLVQVHEMSALGQHHEAIQEHQRPFNRANEVFSSTGDKHVQGLKQILQWQGVITSTECVARQPLTASEAAALRRLAEADPLLGPTLIPVKAPAAKDMGNKSIGAKPAPDRPAGVDALRENSSMSMSSSATQQKKGFLGGGMMDKMKGRLGKMEASVKNMSSPGPKKEKGLVTGAQWRRQQTSDIGQEITTPGVPTPVQAVDTPQETLQSAQSPGQQESSVRSVAEEGSADDPQKREGSPEPPGSAREESPAPDKKQEEEEQARGTGGEEEGKVAECVAAEAKGEADKEDDGGAEDVAEEARDGDEGDPGPEAEAEGEPPEAAPQAGEPQQAHADPAAQSAKGAQDNVKDKMMGKMKGLGGGFGKGKLFGKK